MSQSFNLKRKENKVKKNIKKKKKKDALKFFNKKK